MTVKRIGDEEFDLIDDLHGFVRLLTLALWRRLATEKSDLQAYGALSLCARRRWPPGPEDSLALLESGYAASNGDPAAFKKWFEPNGRKAMERVEGMLQPVDKLGLDEIFGLLTRHTLDLGLQPVTIEFVRQVLQTLLTTLANMDANASDACRRRSAVLVRAVHGDFAAIRRGFHRPRRRSGRQRGRSPPFSRNWTRWWAWNR